MSTMLAARGIVLSEGYRPQNIPSGTDLCIVGNAMTRGNPEVEHILDSGMPFTSGPEWLHRYALAGRRVIAIAGTHGKTATTAMVCRVLDHAGHDCGFLVGGVPGNFEVSARLGTSPWFVIEADEYDTAFFDKRSKFVHYHPRIALLNNLEYDHADIFSDIGQIKTQVHHLVRTIARSGTVVVNADDENLADALSRGCWSTKVYFSAGRRPPGGVFRLGGHDRDYTSFEIVAPGGETARVSWPLFGAFNAANALACAAVCDTAGISLQDVAAGLAGFKPPKRRLELIAECDGVRVYEDFAHHPTAIARIFDALEARHPGSRLVAVLEPRSNTMQRGVHNAELAEILSRPALCLMLRGDRMQWDAADLAGGCGSPPCRIFDDSRALLDRLLAAIAPGDVVVLMSNGGFGGLPAALAAALGGATEPRGKSVVNPCVPASNE